MTEAAPKNFSEADELLREVVMIARDARDELARLDHDLLVGLYDSTLVQTADAVQEMRDAVEAGNFDPELHESFAREIDALSLASTGVVRELDVRARQQEPPIEGYPATLHARVIETHEPDVIERATGVFDFTGTDEVNIARLRPNHLRFLPTMPQM